MELKTQVKVSRINNLHDARYCAGMGVPFVGFSLDPTDEKFVKSETFNEIKGWVEGTKFVGEIASEAKVALGEYKLDALQTSKPEALTALASYDLPLILKLNLDAESEEDVEQYLTEHKAECLYFILETTQNLLENEVLGAKLCTWAKEVPLFLAAPFMGEEVLKFLEAIPLAGVVLEAGEEIKVGYKDFDELADVLEALEVLD